MHFRLTLNNKNCLIMSASLKRISPKYNDEPHVDSLLGLKRCVPSFRGFLSHLKTNLTGKQPLATIGVNDSAHLRDRNLITEPSVGITISQM